MHTIQVVKIGSESLLDFNKSQKVQNLVDGIAKKMSEWIKVILVSSWAVQFWREKTSREIQNKQVLAALGWHHLLNAYSDKFRRHGLSVAGFLWTHADIEDKVDRARTLVETINATWETGFLVPIINENDPLSTEEMREVGRWADNDKNALLLARLFHAQTLYLITNTNGVYRDPSDPSSRIEYIDSNALNQAYISSLCSGKSTIGTWGMASKLEVAHEAWKSGIKTHIWNGIDSWIHSTDGWTTIVPLFQ